MVLAFCAASFGGLQRLLRALVAAVGEKHEDLAAGLGLELIVRGEIDGVIEQRSARPGGGKRAPLRCWRWSWRH